jgi:TolB-like protein
LRSDIFSFGIVLYEALNGRRPFEGVTDMDVLQAIVRLETPALPSEIPAGLRTLVEKALEKDPAERYQTMRDLVVDLRRLTRLPSEKTGAAAAPIRNQHSWMWIGIAAGVVLLAGGAAWWQKGRAGPAMIRSIAVLPFQNFSGDASQEYLSDGTTEALISNLAQIRALKVISRTSVMRYKGTTKSLPEIGRELGADAVIEGSVHRVGDRVRITAQLIQASTDTHLWAKDYEQEIGQMLELEGDVARAIAHEVQVQLTPEETARVSSTARVNPAAQEEYLLGSYNRWRLKDADLRQAIEHFQRAIQIQSDYAAAYAGLSGALAERGTRDSEAPARDAARKALDLDPQLSEAHSALARMSMTYEWDWADAEQEFKRALELDPNSLEVCQCYPDLLATMGRFPEAIAILERGAAVNPLSSAIQTALGRVKLWGRYSDALTHLRKASEIDPENALAYLYSGEAYEVSGDLQKALSATEQFHRLRGVDFEKSPLVGRIYAKMGRREDALRILSNLTKPGSNPNARDLATLYFALGDKDRGFESLTKAFDERQDVLRANVSALYDDVRADPRFKALIARLKFPEPH